MCAWDEAFVPATNENLLWASLHKDEMNHWRLNISSGNLSTLPLTDFSLEAVKEHLALDLTVSVHLIRRKT